MTFDFIAYVSCFNYIILNDIYCSHFYKEIFTFKAVNPIFQNFCQIIFHVKYHCFCRLFLPLLECTGKNDATHIVCLSTFQIHFHLNFENPLRVYTSLNHDRGSIFQVFQSSVFQPFVQPYSYILKFIFDICNNLRSQLWWCKFKL